MSSLKMIGYLDNDCLVSFSTSIMTERRGESETYQLTSLGLLGTNRLCHSFVNKNRSGGGSICNKVGDLAVVEW